MNSLDRDSLVNNNSILDNPIKPSDISLPPSQKV